MRRHECEAIAAMALRVCATLETGAEFLKGFAIYRNRRKLTLSLDIA